MDIPTAHLLLRDRRHWYGQMRGLQVDADGVLGLSRLPGPRDGKAVQVDATYPVTRAVSGLAVGPCEVLFVADTAHDRVWFEDGLCNSRAWLPVALLAPRGLAISEHALWVADSGHGRLQGLALPLLEAHLAWPTGSTPGTTLGTAPTSLAVDSQGRLLAVVDAPLAVLRRWWPNGDSDAAFDANVAMALAAAPGPSRPHQVAVGADDGVWLSDSLGNVAWRLAADGSLVQALIGPAGWLPGALAVQGERAFVADAADGSIHVFDGPHWLGRLPLWQGPVTALALSLAGDLFIKPGLDHRFIRFSADASCVHEGEIEAGPFDAGQDRCWERAWTETLADLASSPAGWTAVTPPTRAATAPGSSGDSSGDTDVTLSVALQDLAAPAPAPTAWQAVPSGDALLAPWATASGARFVWLRLRLRSPSGRRSPQVAQLRCATASENYLDHLPQTYAMADGVDGFLARWLKLLRSEFAQTEEWVDEMPARNDGVLSAASNLPWLSGWLALELPRIADNDERRAILARALALHARRGTPASIAELVELHTGIRPAIVESFVGRRIGALDAGSRLDVDTRLAVLDPAGMVVPDEEVAMPIGRLVVGQSGPLASTQLGLPLYADEAWRFCVVVDAYRASRPGVLDELRRIVDREKPAHTDYRVELVWPEMSVGLQSRVGIDSIVGGTPPRPWFGPGTLGLDTELAEAASGRLGEQSLDGTLTLL